MTPPVPRDYVYETPRGLRDVASSERKTSPFCTLWYVWLGPTHTAEFYRWWVDAGQQLCPRLSLACSEFFLSDNFKDSADRTRRKAKKRKRAE
jgi:hypothetical protein